MSDHKKPMLDDTSLEALFADAAADAGPSDALTARVLADAAAVVHVPGVVPRDGFWARITDAVGGWPSLGGLATAAVAGIYVGFADPTVLETVGFGDTSFASTDMLLSDDAFFDDVTLGEG